MVISDGLPHIIVTFPQTGSVFAKLGLSPSQVALAVFSLLAFIATLFAFIFIGIGAFAVPGGFTASINSILPIAAGTGASKSSADPGTAAKEDGGVDELLDEVQDESNEVD